MPQCHSEAWIQILLHENICACCKCHIFPNWWIWFAKQNKCSAKSSEDVCMIEIFGHQWYHIYIHMTVKRVRHCDSEPMMYRHRHAFLFPPSCELAGHQWYLWKRTCSRLTLWGSGCESTGEPLCTGGVAPARIHWIWGGSSIGLATSPANISKYLAPRLYWGNSRFRNSANSLKSSFRWSSK